MSKQSSDDKLQDAGTEASVIAGILQHGPDCLLDIEDIISPNDFHWRHNKNIFSLLQYLVKEKDVKTFDIPTLICASKERSCQIISKGDPTEFLESLFEYKTSSQENTQKMAVVIFKLSLARRGIKHLIDTKNDLLEITGQEGIDEIIGKIEEPIFDFTSKLISQNDGLKPLCEDLIENLKILASTPQDMVGLPTGYPKWDKAIGGGLRRGTVNVIASRPKVGKSFICMNMARNIAENNIPVLYLDTELLRSVQMHRLTSLITGVELDHIETGKFAQSETEKKTIWDLRKEIQGLAITHCSIAGQNIQNAISVARRWMVKSVGFNDQGQANPCLAIYDYLKLTNADEIGSKRMQETQLLGFLISALHDFAMQWGIPILATVQLNRDGVNQTGGEFAAGSDRFLWLGSNFSVLKRKTRKEMAEDPPSNGTKKLMVTDTRYGPGMFENEYINIIDNLRVGKLQEGKMHTEAINDNFMDNKAE